MTTQLPADLTEQLTNFCEHWKVLELAIFGSAIRNDFTSKSDIDLLATFSPDVNWSLFDHVEMELELESIFGRDVDLVSKSALSRSENWIRRDEISNTAQVIFSRDEKFHVSR
jgi:predicted nucleotidyltransferase